MRLVRLPGVFRPPSDAWMLVGCLRQEPLREGLEVLDLCSGSGVLALAAALEGASAVTAVDVSRRAVLNIRMNALLNGVKIDARRGDLFAAIGERRFDVIVSNPPYLPGEQSELPRRGLARAWEGGPTGLAVIDRIAAGARDHLTPNGVLLLVCSTVCGEDRILAALSSGGLQPAVILRHRGPLGPRLSARADWLRKQGRLLPGDEEEILVIRAPLASALDTRARGTRPERSGFPSPGRRHSTSSPSPSPGLNAPARAGAS